MCLASFLRLEGLVAGLPEQEGALTGEVLVGHRLFLGQEVEGPPGAQLAHHGQFFIDFPMELY
jgi:hypothetical protein